MEKIRKLRASASILTTIAMLAMSVGALAQTRVVAPKNPYAIAKDVELGRQAATEVERQLPMVNDSYVQQYVKEIGQRLVQGVPAEFRHEEFRYSFDVVNARDINAFALPGGFTFVNRGLIEAANTEGELAGVMAHEISHVALRHGTAQAAKAQKYSIGQVGAQILGAIIGGGVGSAVGTLGSLGIGAAFLRYSRDYERQADTLGAQIMANAGYDPRDLANMFRTIERQGSGSGGPEWMSSHPNPGNRYEAINREAELLRVRNPNVNNQEFTRIRARLRDMPRAPSMEEVSRRGGNYPSRGGTRNPGGRVAYPSTRYVNYNGGNVFRLSHPDNWRQLPGNNEVWFAPDGGFGEIQGTPIFTHGVSVGVTQAGSRNLRQATDEFIRTLAQTNQNLRQRSSYQRGTIDGREALAMTLGDVNVATRRNEVVSVYTTLLRNGDLFYMVAVAPEDEFRDYQNAFQTILRSIRLNG